MPLTSNRVVRSLIALIARIIRLKARLTVRASSLAQPFREHAANVGASYFAARPSQSVGRRCVMRSASGEPGCGMTS